MRRAVLIFCVAFCGNAISHQIDPFMKPNSKIDSRTAETLSADWWKWAMSFTAEESPVSDRVGLKCGAGQTGSVWFLAGGFGSSKISRECEVPAGRYIFFPIINVVYFPNPDDSSPTCASVCENATVHNEGAVDLFLEIDGKTVEGLKKFRVKSKECFNLFERSPRLAIGRPGFPAASDGYWVVLRPLPPGVHHIKFGGKYRDVFNVLGGMIQDIEYKLTIREEP